MRISGRRPNQDEVAAERLRVNQGPGFVRPQIVAAKLGTDVGQAGSSKARRNEIDHGGEQPRGVTTAQPSGPCAQTMITE